MTEIATETIKENILNGTYRPGTRLIPAQMEKELQLGRVAIREALRVLTGNGLVRGIPNKGVVVSEPLGIEEMKEVYDIRVVLEGKACELAVTKISMQQIAHLEELNRMMSVDSLDLNDYFELNRKFHLELYKASGWDFLCQLISQIHDRISLFRGMFPFDNRVVKKYVTQHARIIKSIKARDVEKTNQLMSTHLREGYFHMMEQKQFQRTIPDSQSG